MSSRRYGSSERQKRNSTSWSSSWRNEPSAKRTRFDDDTYEPQLNRKAETSSRVMLTFKKFMETFDDSLSDEEAISKYNDYKFDFRKQEFEKFFEAHKENEWFRNKYHPESSKEIVDQQRKNLNKRLEIYQEFVEKNGFGKDLRFDVENCENLIRFMDAVVVKLEGGSDEDVELVLKEPIYDESIEELQKKKNATNGNGEANGNGSALTNGDSTKMDVDNDSSAIQELLKRVPYKTQSISFRSIPETAKLEDIENECKNHIGFLRTALTEPLNNQNFSRHLLVSFRRDVQIREIFWNIKDAKFIEGIEAQPSVNRDLRRRVRTVNGIAHHRPIVQNDIRQAARLIALYDYKRRLFIEDEQAENPKDLDALIKINKNPLLSGIFEYFVEESNAEEEELLGSSKQNGEDLKFPLEVDPKLLEFLDKLLIYLRVVHSIDCYNYTEYINEDSMPNRMGMIHVRDVPLTGEEYGKSSAGIPLVTKKAIDSFISNNDERLKSTILKYEFVSEDDLKRLGKKDPEQVLEDFIQANCVELAQDKWLCPLSGKKFKGPEFIRKHLNSKHEQKLDEIKAEAVFFNNYLADPQRPHNPEPKPLASVQKTETDEEPRRQTDDRGDRGGYRNWNDRQQRFGGNQRFGGDRFGGNNRHSDHGGNRSRPSDDFGARRDPRQLTSYRDLDAAPSDII